MLRHTGSTFQISQNGLVTTSAAQTSSQPLYALEGSVFVAGAVVQLMLDGLHAFKKSSEIEALSHSVSDSGHARHIGPAWCRVRVFQCVSLSVGSPYFKHTKNYKK